MSTVMTVLPLEELDTNLVCAPENVINSVVLIIAHLTTYFVVEGKYTSNKGEELIQGNIYNPVRRNTNNVCFIK